MHKNRKNIELRWVQLCVFDISNSDAQHIPTFKLIRHVTLCKNSLWLPKLWRSLRLYKLSASLSLRSQTLSKALCRCEPVPFEVKHPSKERRQSSGETFGREAFFGINTKCWENSYLRTCRISINAMKRTTLLWTFGNQTINLYHNLS